VMDNGFWVGGGGGGVDVKRYHDTSSS
jgi:hypothetical protein